MIRVASGISIKEAGNPPQEFWQAAKTNPEGTQEQLGKAGYPPAQAAIVLSNSKKNIASNVPPAPVGKAQESQKQESMESPVPGVTFTPPAAG